MGNLKKIKKQGIPHFSLQSEAQVIVGENPRNQAAAVPVDLSGYPLGEDDRPGFSQPFFFPVRERPAGTEDIEVFFNTGMQGSDHELKRLDSG